MEAGGQPDRGQNGAAAIWNAGDWTDERTFSLGTTMDTKSFDQHAARIAAVLAGQFGESGANADLIWKKIGIERFGHPVHVKGPMIVKAEPDISPVRSEDSQRRHWPRRVNKTGNDLN